MKDIFFIKITLYTFFIFALSSCDISYFEDAEIEDLTLDGGIAAPIGSLNYTPATLFDQLTSEELSASSNDENTVTLIYEEELEGEHPDAFYKFPDQSFSEEVQTGINMLVPAPADAEFDFVEAFDISMEVGDKANVELTKVIFKEGNLVFETRSDLGVRVDLTFSIESIKSVVGDHVLTFQTTIDPLVSNTYSTSIPLLGYYADLSKDSNGASTSNNFVIVVHGKAYIETGDQVTPVDKLSYTLGLEEIETESVFGDFKQHPFQIDNKILEIDLFNDFQSGEAIFANPSVNISFRNSFGVPIGIDLSQLYVNDEDGNKITLEGLVTDELQIINAPIVNEVGTETTTVLSINANNSNIVDLISSRPNAFFIDVTAISNPSNGPVQENFLLDDSKISADVKMEVPLEINFKDIVLQSEIDFSPIDETFGAKFFRIVVNSENSLPLSGNLLLQFVDENNNPVYTTPVIEAFTATESDNSGKGIGETKKSSYVDLSESEFLELEKAVSINTFVTFNTFDSNSGKIVKLAADDKLKIDLGFSTEIEYSENND